MKKLLFLLSLSLVLCACDFNVQTDNTTAQITESAPVETTTVAEITDETTVETTADAAPMDMPYETVYLPVREGESYSSHRYNDRYVVFLRYVDDTGRYDNISVLDLETCEFVYDEPIDVFYSIFTYEYWDGKFVMIASEYDDDSHMIITEENGVFSHEVTKREERSFTYEYLTSPDGKYAAYPTYKDGTDGGIDVKYPDGSVKRVLSNDRSGDLASHCGYYPQKFIDNTRFVYHISGYEWTSGFGIYNVETDEKIEVLEGQYPYAFFDGGFFTTVEKDYIVWEIYKHDASGQGTLIASREETDGAFELKSDCNYIFEGSVWLEIFDIRYCDENQVTFYSADFQKELGKIVYADHFGGNMFVYGDKIVIAQPKVVELTPEEIKERDAKMIAEHIIHHVMDLDEWAASDYECSPLDMLRFISSLTLYHDDNNHPYSSMVSLSDDGSFYEISKEDGDFINTRLFRVHNWEKSSYYETVFDEDKGGYYTPYGIGVWITPYTYKNMTAHSDDKFITVYFELISSDKFEYEYKEYGEYVFTFAKEDLTLLDFDTATPPQIVIPWYVTSKEIGGIVTKYEFTDDGGMLVTYDGNVEDYYNSNGLKYKTMYYDDRGIFSSKIFYTYDENGLLAKEEHYNSFGELTFKETYTDGKSQYWEYYVGEFAGSWRKLEYNEQGLLVKESWHSGADPRDVMHTDEVVEYFYDDEGKKIKTIATYDGEDVRETEYFYDENGYETHCTGGETVRTYYPDGTLKSEKWAPRQWYEINIKEYLPNGKLLRSADIYNSDIEDLGEYEEVRTYEFYEDGRIKGATFERYDLGVKEYKREIEVKVNYSAGGRIRTDTYYKASDTGELEFACEVWLERDKDGNFSYYRVARGDAEVVRSFREHDDLDYNRDRYHYDDVGRLERVTNGSEVKEIYYYSNCTQEQYELYQKVMGNREK